MDVDVVVVVLEDEELPNKLLTTDDAVLLTAEASTLTETEALAAELELDEDSSAVSVEEYV